MGHTLLFIATTALLSPKPLQQKPAVPARHLAVRSVLTSPPPPSAPGFEEPPAFEEPGPVQDALSGLTVAFSLLSKAIACSAIVGVDPLTGIWSSVVMGLAAPALGMRTGVIVGSAAVVAVPLGSFVAANGPDLIPLVVLLAALIEAAVGALGLIRAVELVSPQVLAGFLNGLGALLFVSQLKVFSSAPELWPAVGTAALCAVVTLLLPRFTSASVPSSLVGLGLASAAGPALGLQLATLVAVVGVGGMAISNIMSNRQRAQSAPPLGLSGRRGDRDSPSRVGGGGGGGGGDKTAVWSQDLQPQDGRSESGGGGSTM